MKNPEDIFEAVRQLPAGERVVYLEEVCENPEQRALVEALLADAEMADGYFGEIESAEPPAAEQPGDQIGPYKLLQQIGEGGFGAVFMAEQREPIDRRVALKIIKRGMDTREVIARFEVERQALAMMDHPNIAKVLDAGSTARGRPYFVMELVKGIPVTTFCDEQKLRTSERLELFRDICSAVNHAHQKGIIHRDLKPSNILVTLHGDKAVPKIIDFGIAKATQQRLTDKTLFTRFEQFIGTPVYMSPEQAALSGLDVDTRSDIYALGVLLYELLSGKPPFDSRSLQSAGYDEMRRIIREEEPPRPSTRIASLAGDERATFGAARRSDARKLSGQLRGELDWIVMKAIEKDRSRRYETANAFALDIRRFLDGDPVTAAAPSPAYRFRKFARRRKAPLAVACSVALALVSGAVVTSWQAVRAGKEAGRKTETLAKLRNAAPAFLRQAEDLVQVGRPAEAVEKIEHARALQPESTAFFLRQAQLLQAQLLIEGATEAYAALLELEPKHEEARQGLTLCSEVLAFERTEGGELSTEALAALRLGMENAGRPASELAAVTKRFKEAAEQLKATWLERLRDLPVGGERPLEKRLAVHRVGRFVLDLSGTSVTDLEPLQGMPLGRLDLANCRGVRDLTPLANLPLRALILYGTSVRDLAGLGDLSHLAVLNLAFTGVRDLSPLEGLPLQELSLRGCRGVRDLDPLRGMPLKKLTLCTTSVSSFAPLEGLPLNHLEACAVPAQDVSRLSNLPLKEFVITNHQFTDLGFVEKMPLEMLSIVGCFRARNYGALNKIPTLQNLSLPADLASLPEEEHGALDTLLGDQSSLRLATDWKDPGDTYTTTERKESFARRWGSVRRLVKILRREGLDYELTREDKTSYNLRILTPSFDSFSILDEARLEGIQLHSLNVSRSAVSNLAPLRGMQIEELVAYNTNVEDLEPLREMRSLKRLEVAHTPVHDIEALRGLPLEKLTLDGTQVTDVSPLAGMTSLRTLMLPFTVADFEMLRELPLEWVSFWWDFKNHRPRHRADQFWHLEPGEMIAAGAALKKQDWEGCREYFASLASRTLQNLEPDADSALLLLQPAAVLASYPDPQPYRELGSRILARFEDCEDAASLERSARAVLIVDSGDPDLKDRACDMLRRAYQGNFPKGDDSLFHLSRALAELRGGDSHSVTKFLDRIEGDDPRLTTAALALEAMAEQLTGNPGAARAALEQARKQLAELQEQFERRVDRNDEWHDILCCRLLTDEAAGLVEGSGKENQ